MSALLDRLREDKYAALKAGELRFATLRLIASELTNIRIELRRELTDDEQRRLATLRLLDSELTYRRIELGRELTDDDVIRVLSRARQQRLESEKRFTRGARPELAAREAAEAVIIQEYLPAPLDEAALNALIGEAIGETGATSINQMRAVMAHLRPAITGRADAALVSRKVRDRLSRS